ncbi:MAG TPA: polysaccharide deacetylase family protein [Cytophagaceae bacterium]|nr:polysaccharide deacetylase family protein [Cytophagaceae bacterium]
MENTNRVTIIMYHYVRDFLHSRYPEIKGLDITLFKAQIDYLMKHYAIITMETLIDAIETGSTLPAKAALLTFDDAYSDHYQYVFPILSQKKIQGSFFPPVKAITEHKVLDVNKIHFILASIKDKKKIITEVNKLLNYYRKEYSLESNEYYYTKLAIANRFDPAEVVFIKRLLQVELKEELRHLITDVLFKKYIGIPEESFSRELYMNIDQLKCMKQHGMHIGSHGYDHYWLGSLTKEKQIREVSSSLDFLKEVNGDIKQWTMCYPYGNYNKNTFEVLEEYACKLAVTTEVNVASVQTHHRYALPRLDTNDLPKDRMASTNEWYAKG